jgi:hypothetical protein
MAAVDGAIEALARTRVMARAPVEREIAYQGLTTVHIVDTMHERKTLMCDLSDGFIAGRSWHSQKDFRAVDVGSAGHSPKASGFLNVKGRSRDQAPVRDRDAVRVS